VLYIAGSGRSGSTLLERMLAQMDPFVTLGEVRHLWRHDYARDLCGCGRPLRTCPFWTPILMEAVGDPPDFPDILALRQRVDRIRFIPHMLSPWKMAAFAADSRRYRSILYAIYRMARHLSGRDVVVDSSKDLSTLYLLSTMPAIALHVVHLVRDSRAVAYSWQRKRRKPEKVGQHRFMPTFSAREAGWDWLYRNLLSEAVRSRAASFVRVHYESMVEQPQVILERIARSVGISAPRFPFLEDGMVHFTTDSHTASGNPMRFQSGPVPLILDDAWEEELSAGDRRIVTLLTWPLLRRYGYSV
jgi:hypothetical protein